jgi:beta-lactamase class C
MPRVALPIVLSTVIGLTVGVPSAFARPQRRAVARAGSCPSAFVSRAQRALDAYAKTSKTTGIAVAFYDRGQSCVLTTGSEGGRQTRAVTPATAFAMGSIEKVFNATLLSLDIVKGRATIDDAAAKYLSGANGARVTPNAPFSRITLKELVTHSSALPRKPPNETQRIGMNLYRDKPLPAAVVAFLNTWRPSYPPGTKYVYSNLGFVLAGTVAVDLARQPYTRFLSEALTGPLGMTRTGVICATPTAGCAVAHAANGRATTRTPVGLWTTGDDMLRFIEANLGDLTLPPDLARAIAQTHVELFRVGPDHAVGMGWEERNRGQALLLSKDGLDSNFSSWVGFEPNRDRGVAVLRNGDGKPEAGEFGQQLLALAAPAQ